MGEVVQNNVAGSVVDKPGDWQALVFVEPPDNRLPLSVQTLLRPDVDYEARLAVLQLLPTELSSREVEGLLYYVCLAGPREGLIGMQERLLKKETMDLLSRQPSCIEPVVQGLVSTYRNGKQDVVVRNYAFHYLSFLHDRVSDDLRGFIGRALWSAPQHGEVVAR